MTSFDGLIELQRSLVREAAGQQPRTPGPESAERFQGLLQDAIDGVPGQQEGGDGAIGRVTEGEGAAAGRAGDSFGASLRGALDEVVARQSEVKEKVEALASGKPVELHDLMVAMGKSEVTFNLMLEVRNKFVDAWRELNRSVV